MTTLVCPSVSQSVRPKPPGFFDRKRFRLWHTHKEKNDPHDQVCQSVCNSSESHQNSQELLTMIEFTYYNDFWCTGSWDTHKEKNDLHDHLCPSVCNLSTSHQKSQELLTMIEFT